MQVIVPFTHSVTISYLFNTFHAFLKGRKYNRSTDEYSSSSFLPIPKVRCSLSLGTYSVPNNQSQIAKTNPKFLSQCGLEALW
jgi:hypothetical protein